MPLRGVIPSQSSEKQQRAFHSCGPSRTVFADDYEERFPEDEYCQETAPNARVWRVYVEEAEAFDKTMDRQYRDGLDVMLVFVSLSECLPTARDLTSRM